MNVSKKWSVLISPEKSFRFKFPPLEVLRIQFILSKVCYSVQNWLNSASMREIIYANLFRILLSSYIMRICTTPSARLIIFQPVKVKLLDRWTYSNFDTDIIFGYEDLLIWFTEIFHRFVDTILISMVQIQVKSIHSDCK